MKVVHLPAASSRVSGEDRIRLAVFTSHPIQYNASLFRALADESRLRPVIFYGCRHGLEPYRDSGFDKTLAWDIPLLDGYESVFLKNRSVRPDPSSYLGVIVPEVRRHWTKHSFDAALLLGWYTLGHLQALRAAWAAGIPVVVRGDSTLARRPSPRRLARFFRNCWLPARHLLYRRLFSRVEAFLTVGTRNEAYYRHFGVSGTKLVRAGYSIDFERFALPPEERRHARRAIRSLLQVGADTTVYLFVGKLIAEKSPEDALEAFSALVPDEPNAILAFVGDGASRPRLMRRASTSSAFAKRVRFAGFVNQADLPRWYAAADCLVLTSSTETWGLVVNEAMAAGLPVIASAAAGCAPDLVREGENGWTYPSGDIAELTLLLRRFLALSRPAQAAMGGRSREIVAAWTPEAVAKRCGDVLERIVRDRPMP